MVALESDLNHVQGGIAKEGIHMGVMSATLELLQRSFLGSSITDGVLRFQPRLLDRLAGVAFSMRFRGTSLRVSIKGEALRAQAEGICGPKRVGIGDEVRELGPGSDCVFRPAASTAGLARKSDGDRRGAMSSGGFQGDIFDVDGVLVDSPHLRAWKESLRDLMEHDWPDVRDRCEWSDEPFTRQVYDFARPGMSLLDVFDADLSGRDLAHGKPDPEIFLTAAVELGIPAEPCFVVEDAASGVQAAKSGKMAALGVARADDQELLVGAHVDLVVTSLDEVDVAGLARHRLARVSA